MAMMNPDRAEAILRGVLASLRQFHDELEVIDAMRRTPTPAVQHLLASMAQSIQSLEQLIDRG